MQDSDKRTVRAMKAIEAQAKAIEEVFKVSESVALRIVEERIRQILEIARGCAAADGDWALSAIEALSAGCKCGEGACKAKEEAQAPVPVRKPATPEATPKATDGMIWLRNVLESVKAMALEAESKSADVIWLRKMAESVRAMELEAAPEATDGIWVGSQNRVTIPRRIIELAEGINGTLKSKRHKFGALTVINGNCKVTVLFGDKSAKHKGARVVHLNCKGQAQFCVSPAFTDGDAVKCSLLKDGTIILTMDDVANMDGTIPLTALIGE